MFDIVDPYLDSDGWSAVWLPSTPHYCLDYLECQVTNTVEGTSGSASLLVEDTFGKKGYVRYTLDSLLDLELATYIEQLHMSRIQCC